MSRKEQFAGSGVSNPVVKYYTFKGKSDGFVWYNKETGKEETQLPLSFALLTVRNEVSGYHKKTKGGIWSNSISEYGTGKEEMRVYSQNPDKEGNTALAQGIWKDISEKAKGQGGHFTKVLIGYEFGVGIIKINLTGTGIASYGDFVKALSNKSALGSNFVEVLTTSKKDEDDDYTIPVFTLGAEFTSEQDGELDEAFSSIEEYFKSKLKKTDEVEDDFSDMPTSMGGATYSTSNVEEPVEADGLPF
jgi:hypothetical protein